MWLAVLPGGSSCLRVQGSEKLGQEVPSGAIRDPERKGHRTEEPGGKGKEVTRRGLSAPERLTLFLPEGREARTMAVS